MKIVCTIAPLKSILEAIAHKEDEVTLLISPQHSPHTYQSRPEDLWVLENSQMVYWVGSSYESSLAKGIIGLGSHRHRMVIEWVQEPIFSQKCHHDHDDDLGGHLSHNHTHSHDSKDQHSQCSHHNDEQEVDPHFWLDPLEMETMVDHIVNHMQSLAPHRKKHYEEQGNLLKAQLKTLHLQLEKVLSPIIQKPFLVYHDGYGYLARRYNLGHRGGIYENLSAGLSYQDQQSISKKTREEGILCLFSEPQFPQERLLRLGEMWSLKIGILDPFDTGNLTGFKGYEHLMKGLAYNLLSHLKDSPHLQKSL